MIVTVLTSALPERHEMLAEARASVAAQTWGPVEHLIGIDHERIGAGPVLNRLFEGAMGDWVMVCDDDDLLDEHHIETLFAKGDPNADVIYTLPRVEGGSFTQYHQPFDAARLARQNIVSHNALVKADWLRKVGGWNAVRWFDWDLFCRLEAAGARFDQIPEETWTYRLHGSNWSQGNLEGAP